MLSMCHSTYSQRNKCQKLYKQNSTATVTVPCFVFLNEQHRSFYTIVADTVLYHLPLPHGWMNFLSGLASHRISCSRLLLARHWVAGCWTGRLSPTQGHGLWETYAFQLADPHNYLSYVPKRPSIKGSPTSSGTGGNCRLKGRVRPWFLSFLCPGLWSETFSSDPHMPNVMYDLTTGPKWQGWNLQKWELSQTFISLFCESICLRYFVTTLGS